MIFKNSKYLLIIMLSAFLFFNLNGFAFAAEVPLRGFFKTEFLGEDVSKTLPPNVMFLLDISSAMTYSTDGVMPNKNDNRLKSERAQMIQKSTFGQGMRPPQFNGEEAIRIDGGFMNVPHPILTDNDAELSGDSFNRFGRDVNQDNNLIGDPYCYYTSDPEKPFLLTFRNRYLAHCKGIIRENPAGSGRGTLASDAQLFSSTSILPNSGEVGTLPRAQWLQEVSKAYNIWQTLRQYIPESYVKDSGGYWIPDPDRPKKSAVPVNLANLYLVPNDSRFYMMKLTLWRITDQANSYMLSRMNVGVATTYSDYYLKAESGHAGGYSFAIKNKLDGAKEGEQEFYGATAFYRHGTAASYVTGPRTASNELTDDKGKSVLSDLFMSQWTAQGVWGHVYTDRNPGDDFYNAISRSIMHIPFDKFYVLSSDDKFHQTEKLKDFRTIISGYESYNAVISADHRVKEIIGKPVKNELWASSMTLLATSIYGGQNSSEGVNFPFHKNRRITNATMSDDGLVPTGQYLIQFAVGSNDNRNPAVTANNSIFLDSSINLEGLGTGKAIGSVFDFFNPPTNPQGGNGFDGVNFGTDSAGFFPVTGSCQSNWLIVFTSGMDSVPNYKPSEAIEKLFKNTLKIRGRRWTGSNWVEEIFDMDSGVRTLVVGFLPDPVPNEDPKIYDTRVELYEMARHGDPIEVRTGNNVTYQPNPIAEPEFGNDVPGLVKALNNVLKRINVDRLGSGTVNIAPVIDNVSDPDTRVVFGASYRINPLDQWSGWLYKYTVISNDRSRKEWEANELMMSAGVNRKLYTSTGLKGTSTTTVAEVTPNLIRTTLAISNNNDAVKFDNWLRRFDGTPIYGEAAGALGDMVNSGITVVGPPRNDSLKNDPNHGIRSRDSVVYIQTNRGALHAFNYMTGHEVWGFYPPNIFQHKIKDMKFTSTNSYIEGNGLTQVKSNSMVLLDGMLIARDCENNGAVKTLLTGYLGNGGNGFYTMNITEMDSSNKPPTFEWAIENARYGETGTYSVGDRVKRWGAAAVGDVSNYDYTDLGLTVVPGVYFTPNGDPETIGVLPGGLGHVFGQSQGRAFYFFDPTNGSIRKKIDMNSVPSTGLEMPAGEKLGMAISPVLFHENARNKAIAFYTADSEGNIFKCNTDGVSLQNMKMKSIFQLKTIGPLIPYEGSVTNPAPAGQAIAIPRKMTLLRAKTSQLWLFGGTSNIGAPGSDIDDTKKIINGEQFIFGLNTKNILESSEVDSGIAPLPAILGGKMRYNTYYEDGMPAKYGSYGQSYRYDDNIGVTEGMGDYGWILRLRPKMGVTDNEYLSANPFFMNNVLYFATFVPYIGQTSQEACSDIGIAKLYAIDPSTGLSVNSADQAVLLENIKIAGLSGSPISNRLVLSIKELKLNAHNAIFNSTLSSRNINDIGNYLYEIDGFGDGYQVGGGAANLNGYEELIPLVQYWRERF